MKTALFFSAVTVFTLGTTTAVAEPCESVTDQAQVSAVYPTADTLPENLLRFYVYFSRPMQRDNVLSSIYLADSQGNRLEGVFLDNRFNLWSPDSTRLTLLFDPGRVKTGLVAHNTLGRALKPGQGYQLVIEHSIRDTRGCVLASDHRKSFTATTALNTIPDAGQWTINQPQLNSHEPLSVHFKGIMDHLSLAYRMRVKDGASQSVAGRIDLAENEQQWRFIPANPWHEGPYQLVIDPLLEDIAGNRITGLFDQPSLIRESTQQRHAITLPLSVKKTPSE